ncbi:hypothetical protein JM658_11800 [Joostella atrarenae]|uniref:Fibronectin type-III domain-containing protein n=1 Tax=Joostella atrarenae TaxID=679257 RepID=A0ABS9J500_9FLAO|nr:hypothetical protein [Joostella atrarenae]MCF8715510.1 hypothetical protein [Joostella atrarenae]
MQKLQYITYLSCLLLFLSCGGDSDEPEEPKSPSAATLIFPLENSECTEGVISSPDADISVVTFEWNPSNNTDSYQLTIKDLETTRTQTFDTQSAFQEVTLSRGTPYSWYVASVNSTTLESVVSETWKFYNADEGAISYPPFPADLIEPTPGSTLYSSNTTISFIWEAADIDNDIVGYNVFMGSNNPPTTSIADNTSEETLTYATPSTGVYYWLVKTTDSNGNISTSEISQFKVE